MKKIEVLGTGCAKCKKLEELTREAAGEIGLDCQIEKVDDIQKIMTYGVMMTPALVIDGVVKLSGKVPSVNELKAILSQ
jgi:small redox-active disulfide protein 2